VTVGRNQGAAMPTSPPTRALWAAPLRPLGRAGENLLDRVLCVLGAAGLSQAPEFFQQYLQRLGGHLDEARRQLAGFEEVARKSGLTFRQYIDLLRSQPAEAVADTGARIAGIQGRVESLAAAEAALREAGLWERPFVFLRHADWDIAARTWEVFKPAMPVTFEGLVYAAVGMVLALIVYQGCVATPCRALVGRWKAMRSGPGQPKG
jgi:hypothetical protein